MTHQRAVAAVAAADLTPQMAVNAIRLLARADAAGWQEIALIDLAALFCVAGRATIRKYLGKLRDAGLLDYSLGRDSAVIWFLAWDVSEPVAARTVPAASIKRAPSSATRPNGSAGPAAPWDRI